MRWCYVSATVTQKSYIPLSLLPFVLLFACAPASFLIQPIATAYEGKIPAEHANLSRDEIEKRFTRPFTEMTLFETPGLTAAMLWDYSYIIKKLEGLAGAEEAALSMRQRYVDEGVSFRVVVWGSRLSGVDLNDFRFRLDLKDGRLIDPVQFEPVGSPESQRRPADQEVLWRAAVDVTYPVRLEPGVKIAILQIDHDDVMIDRHTWKFSWE